MFLKLLEAVLKTGNRMNVGTNHGDAQAFKLDTLLKLVEVKGADGKTTLLHFIVQEIIRTECARLNGGNQTSNPTLSDDVKCRRLGLQVVSALSSDLSNVKKAAVMDSDVLSSDVSKLSKGISNIAEVVQLNETTVSDDSSRKFSESMNMFMKLAENEIIRLQAQESVALLFLCTFVAFVCFPCALFFDISVGRSPSPPWVPSPSALNSKSDKKDQDQLMVEEYGPAAGSHRRAAKRPREIAEEGAALAVEPRMTTLKRKRSGLWMERKRSRALRMTFRSENLWVSLVTVATLEQHWAHRPNPRSVAMARSQRVLAPDSRWSVVRSHGGEMKKWKRTECILGDEKELGIFAARNLFTPKDNKILSKRSDELVVQDSLALSVQCASSVSNMGQRLLAQTHQVESLMAEVASLKHEIRRLKHENKMLHVLANNYSTSMKRKLDQLQESESQIQSDH
ncbi:hypothetical protein ACFX13_006549 [Malus domestica]